MLRAATLRLLSSHRVDGTMVDRSHHPRANRTSRSVVPIGAPPHGEECFLHDLLRHVRMTDQPERERMGHGCVPREELAERDLVAGGDPHDEVFVSRHGRSVEPMGALGGPPMVIDTLVFAALLEIG